MPTVTIDQSIFEQSWLREAGPEATLCYIYFITQADRAGVCKVDWGMLPGRFGYPLDSFDQDAIIESLQGRVEKFGGGSVFVIDYIQWQCFGGEKKAMGLVNPKGGYQKHVCKLLKRHGLENHKSLQWGSRHPPDTLPTPSRHPPERVSTPSRDPLKNKHKNKQSSTCSTKSSTKACTSTAAKSDPLEKYKILSAFYPELLALCADHLPKQHPNPAPGDPPEKHELSKVTLAKIIRIDKFTEEQVIDTLKWWLLEPRGEFWRKNGCWSIATLRSMTKANVKKFSMMFGQMNEKPSGQASQAPQVTQNREQNDIPESELPF